MIQKKRNYKTKDGLTYTFYPCVWNHLMTTVLVRNDTVYREYEITDLLTDPKDPIILETLNIFREEMVKK